MTAIFFGLRGINHAGRKILPICAELHHRANLINHTVNRANLIIEQWTVMTPSESYKLLVDSRKCPRPFSNGPLAMFCNFRYGLTNARSRVTNARSQREISLYEGRRQSQQPTTSSCHEICIFHLYAHEDCCCVFL